MNIKIKQAAFILAASALIIGCGKEKTVEKEIIRMVKYEESTLNQGGLDLKFSGSLKPAVESMLSFKINGTLEKINVSIGDKVKKGQVLAVLDKSSYILQAQQAEASYEQAKASLLSMDYKIAEAKTGIAQAKTGILQAKSAIEQAEAAYSRAVTIKNTAEKDFERYRELYLNDSVAQNVFDQAKSGLDQAKAAVEQSFAAVAQAKAAYEQTLAQKEQTEFLLEQANAGKRAAEAQVNAVAKQLELARLQLSYTELAAPIDGTIALKMSEVNENIGAGQPILRIDSGSELEAEIYVSESAINSINIGDKADIFVASVNKLMEGTVTEVGSTSTGFGGTYVIKLNIGSQNNKVLKSGMVVEVKLKTAEKEKYITLPLSAINQDSSGENFVYTVENINNGEGVVVKKSIVIGKLINNRIEILSGIKENEKIITAGVSKVLPGQKVRLYEEVK
jgi:RND family efflux transporter MFP subunit